MEDPVALGLVAPDGGVRGRVHRRVRRAARPAPARPSSDPRADAGSPRRPRPTSRPAPRHAVGPAARRRGRRRRGESRRLPATTTSTTTADAAGTTTADDGGPAATAARRRAAAPTTAGTTAAGPRLPARTGRRRPTAPVGRLRAHPHHRHRRAARHARRWPAPGRSSTPSSPSRLDEQTPARSTRSSPSSRQLQQDGVEPRHPAAVRRASTRCCGTSWPATSPTTTSCWSAGGADGPQVVARRPTSFAAQRDRSGARSRPLVDDGTARAAGSRRTASCWSPCRRCARPRRTGALVVVTYLDRGPGRPARRRCGPTRSSPLLALLLVTALAGWLSGRLLSPLRTLRETAEEIGETDLSRRLAGRRQRRHHRADPHRQRDARPAGGGVRRPARVPRRRRPRAAGPRSPCCAGTSSCSTARTPRTSPRPASCCSTRSTGCRGWSAT